MDLGFRRLTLPKGEISIERDGKTVTVLRDGAARAFEEKTAGASFEEGQQTMARMTGNYRRGNERDAARHPRNR